MKSTIWQDIPAKLMKMTPTVSKDKEVKDDTPRNQNVVVEAEKNKNISIALPLYSPHMPSQRRPYNCVNFLPESSTAIHAGSARGIPEDVLVPVRNRQYAKGASELERGTLYNSSGNDHSKKVDSSHSIDAVGDKQYGQVLNSNNGKAPMSLSRVLQSDLNETFDGENCYVPTALRLRSLDGGESPNKLMSMESQILVQNHASGEPESNEEVANACQPPTVTIAVPGFPSGQDSASRNRIMTSRLRRTRITEVLKSLRELLPQSEKAGREAVLDGTIEYVKYLQLQIKTLSQSRLGGEGSHGPFVYLEGYGHYLFHDEMLSEPLEEILGRLMEVNVPVLNQLLECKGLAVMPMDLAGGLFQAR